MNFRNLCLPFLLLFVSNSIAQNTNPVVSNVIFRISGNTVTVTYDLMDAEQEMVSINMEVSSNSGSTWDFNYGVAIGDIGTNVQIGTNKTISWTYSGEYNSNFIIRIIADDLVGDQIYYAGQIYNTVTIGSQVWLKENLNVGTRIQINLNQANNGVIEKYCYNNDLNNCTAYGGLYQWAEAVQYTNSATNNSSPNPVFTGNVQGICPTGWHIPTQSEFDVLKTNVNNSSNSLKAIGQGTGSGIGTNTSGFTAILSGSTPSANYYSSTEYNGSSQGLSLYMNSTDNYLTLGGSSKNAGLSIRCIKNSSPVKPVLLGVNNNSTNVLIPSTLSWQASNQASHYTLQVSTNSSFTSFIYNQSGLIYTSKAIPELSNSTQYYWRVNAYNDLGTSDWSEVWTFVTIGEGVSGEACPGLPTIIYDGKTYNTIQIGNQCWLKENLNIGTLILSGQNPNDNGIIEKYCYDNLPANCEIYGGLYQWNEAMAYSITTGTKGICPEGWHIPTNSEFQTLRANVNNAGNALKEIGQGTGTGEGTNASGFSGLLAGQISNSRYRNLNIYAFFWSSTDVGNNYVRKLNLASDTNDSNTYDFPKETGISVRCLKD